MLTESNCTSLLGILRRPDWHQLKFKWENAEQKRLAAERKQLLMDAGVSQFAADFICWDFDWFHTVMQICFRKPLCVSESKWLDACVAKYLAGW